MIMRLGRLWILLSLLGLLCPTARAGEILTSPNGRLETRIEVSPSNQLQFQVLRDGDIVLNASKLGITIDGVALGADVVSLSAGETTESFEIYPLLGQRSQAINHYRQCQITAQRSGAGDSSLTMWFRAYDDGIAYRYVIPGSGSRTVTSEQSSWHFPAGSLAWTQANTTYYEDEYIGLPIESVVWLVGPPVVCELSGNSGIASGYVLASEAAVYDYPGSAMFRQSGSTMVCKHKQPSWQVDGGSLTPWRVTLTTENLDDLVNSTLIKNLNPAADPTLVDADWIKPGKALWSWWAHYTRLKDQIPYLDAAYAMDFDYVLWDEDWEYWSDADHNYLLSYARDRQIGVWLWKNWVTLDEQTERDTFFDWIDAKNTFIGSKTIVGIKIDFMNSESQAVMQWYEDVLQDAADRELMINFHGAAKPTGMARTYPHEMTREGVKGLEYHIWDQPLSPRHNAALPFTRLVAGHADYTPVTFWDDRLGQTTFAQQLAMPILLTSPVTHWADDPSRYLYSSARDVIEAMPTIWDETVVLNISDIGDLAALARRKGDQWFLAIANGSNTQTRSLSVPLNFLADWNYNAVVMADSSGTAAGFSRSMPVLTSTDNLNVWMRTGGGCLAMFTPQAGGPRISCTPSLLEPMAETGVSTASDQFQVTNTGNEPVTWTAAESADWFEVQPASGTLNAGESVSVTIDYDTQTLATGSHYAPITVDASDALTGEQTVHVYLTLGGPPTLPIDFDHDGDVDQADFGAMQLCVTGSYVNNVPAGCEPARLDSDFDIDDTDIQLFLGCVSGEGVTADLNCLP